MEMNVDYREFLEAKKAIAKPGGFDISPDEINPILKPHQRAIVDWAVRGGRRAIFAAFGLGKTLIQLEAVRLTRKRAGGRGLIVVPLGVRQEFKRDGAMIGMHPQFVRRLEEAEDPEGIYLTNYETVRDGKMDPRAFSVVSLDEASVLRGFGGTKTFREFMRMYEGTSSYRFVATATPDPNEFIELLAYAAFLDVMDVGQAKTRFFKRDSTKADSLTLHHHKEREFWLWVSSWAVFLQKPSDLGFSDAGYSLPEMKVYWHEVKSAYFRGGQSRDGQGRMFPDVSYGVSEAAREKRESLELRIVKLMEIRAQDPGAHRILWHDLESERHAIEKAIPESVSVYGSQDLDEREDVIIKFSDGEFQELAAKPVIAGSGCNFQRHCAWAIFLGIGFKFNDLIQSIHRIHRFLQPKPVRIDLIYTEAERSIKKILVGKWERYKRQSQAMSEIIKKYGLADIGKADTMRRTIGVERQEISGEGYRMINNDCIEETRTIETESMDLIITSIPFASQYEYTPSYNDFGHTDDTDHFWRQMDFLSPELFRVLRPGRIMAIHVKDRITPGGLTGLGFQTVCPLHAEGIFHFRKHGFAYLGMKTVVTDVVRENNQTYRLGWTEQCKDGSRMGCGMPEYILLFRKPQTDRSNGYGDVPVVKEKENYSLARWQLDAHGFQRSNGNRPLTPEELRSLPHEKIYKRWKEESLKHVYDFDRHKQIGEIMEKDRRLPVTFMLLPPHSWHPDVWTDVARMRTLNMMQQRKGWQMHLCPLQFDIVERLVVQFSMEGETVFDPFVGIGTVSYMAIKLKRKAVGIELNSDYYHDAVYYCAEAEKEKDIPDLFGLLRAEEKGDGDGRSGPD